MKKALYILNITTNRPSANKIHNNYGYQITGFICIHVFHVNYCSPEKDVQLVVHFAQLRDHMKDYEETRLSCNLLQETLLVLIKRVVQLKERKIIVTFKFTII